MRKLFSILLIAGLLFACASVQAEMTRFNQDQYTLTYVIVNDTATGTAYNVGVLGQYPSTGTTMKVRILGYTVTPSRVSTGNLAGLFGMYDTTNTTCPVTALEAEIESTSNASLSIGYSYPRYISEGLQAILGPYTTVTIYYELVYR